MNRYETPYDAAEAAAYEEDRRQALQEAAEEAENEKRQLGGLYWASMEESCVTVECSGSQS